MVAYDKIFKLNSIKGCMVVSDIHAFDAMHAYSGYNRYFKRWNTKGHGYGNMVQK